MGDRPAAVESAGRLILYGRRGCHLCDEMERMLIPYRGRLGFLLSVVDVDSDPALVEQFGDQIPVLTGGGREICRHFLDERALLRHFGRDVDPI